jgi:hypothetical protein
MLLSIFTDSGILSSIFTVILEDPSAYFPHKLGASVAFVQAKDMLVNIRTAHWHLTGKHNLRLLYHMALEIESNC